MVDPTPNTGFAIPLQIDSTGGIAEATDADKIRLSVLTILGTQPGERLMRPSFGCPLRNLAFAPLNAATANLAQFYVQDALTRWEPRIRLDEVQASAITDQDGQPRLLVNVHYHVSASGQAQRVSFQLPLA
jgi:uncharacterized protein